MAQILHGSSASGYRHTLDSVKFEITILNGSSVCGVALMQIHFFFSNVWISILQGFPRLVVNQILYLKIAPQAFFETADDYCTILSAWITCRATCNCRPNRGFETWKVVLTTCNCKYDEIPCQLCYMVSVLVLN